MYQYFWKRKHYKYSTLAFLFSFFSFFSLSILLFTYFSFFSLSILFIIHLLETMIKSIFLLFATLLLSSQPSVAALIPPVPSHRTPSTTTPPLFKRGGGGSVTLPQGIKAPSCFTFLIGQKDSGQKVCLTLNDAKDALIVTYPAVTGYVYKEVHVDLQNTPITGTAPGRYPYVSVLVFLLVFLVFFNGRRDPFFFFFFFFFFSFGLISRGCTACT
jgi:hypothetical protein